MKASKIEALEDYKNELQDCLFEISSESEDTEGEPIGAMIEAIEKIDLKLREAKRIIADIRKL